MQVPSESSRQLVVQVIRKVQAEMSGTQEYPETPFVAATLDVLPMLATANSHFLRYVQCKTILLGSPQLLKEHLVFVMTLLTIEPILTNVLVILRHPRYLINSSKLNHVVLAPTNYTCVD